MTNSWIDALKKWNAGKDMWCLPKKGSKDYDEVRALMTQKSDTPKKDNKMSKSKKEPVPDAEGMAESHRNYEKIVAYFKSRKEAEAAAKAAPEPAKPKAKAVKKVSKKVEEVAAPAPEAKKEEVSDSETEMKKKAEAAAEAAVNKFIQRSKSENRSYLARRRNAISKKVYKETLDRLMAEAKEKKKEKVSAIIADRVHKKKLRGIYGEL
jgi:hypothetical protein